MLLFDVDIWIRYLIAMGQSNRYPWGGFFRRLLIDLIEIGAAVQVIAYFVPSVEDGALWLRSNPEILFLSVCAYAWVRGVLYDVALYKDQKSVVKQLNARSQHLLDQSGPNPSAKGPKVGRDRRR